jgi:hypothetical protein
MECEEDAVRQNHSEIFAKLCWAWQRAAGAVALIVLAFKLKAKLEGHRQVSSCNLGNGIAFGRVGSVRARAFYASAASFRLSPLFEVPARGSKIDGVEAFRKPGIDGTQKLAGLAGAAFGMAQPPKARRSAQFPR